MTTPPSSLPHFAERAGVDARAGDSFPHSVGGLLTDEPASVVPTSRGEVARRVGVSVMIQMSANVGHVVLNVVSSLALIHYFRPSVYGDYVLIIALAGTFGMLADFGINQLAVRQVAVDEHAENAVIGTVIAVRVGLAVVAAAAVQAILFGLGRPGGVRLAALFITTTFLSNAVMAVTIAFHLRLRQHREALIVLLGELIETTGILVLISRRATLPELAAATAVGTAIASIVAVFTTRRMGLRPRVEMRRAWGIVRPAFPLAMAGLAGVMLVKLDSLMLAALRSPRDVGVYGAAYQPVEYWLISVIALMTVMVPLLSRFYATDPARLVALYRRSSESLIALVLPIGALMAFLAAPAIALAYSARYAAAAAPLRVLGISSILMAVSAWHSLVLLSVGRQGLTARYNLAALGVGAVVHALLINAFGIMGAAFGTLTIGVLTAVTSTVLVREVVGLRADTHRLVRVIGAAGAGVVAVFASFSGGLGPWASAALGLVAYLGALWALGLVDIGLLSARLREEVSTSETIASVEVTA